MKSLRLATAAAVVTGLFVASAKADSTPWWNLDFDSMTDISDFTNDTTSAWTYVGEWAISENDESILVDEHNPTNGFGATKCLKLDTQGEELTWGLKDAARPEGTKTLIDADMFFVGAEEDPTGFDNGEVQTALYLKSVTDDNDVTTNNLCIYTYDGSPEVRANVWVPLLGVEVEDNSWHHVQVTVDYSGSVGMVSVKVDGTQMADADGTTSWPIANNLTETKKISSVSFKGTGAVDNFVGVVEADVSVSYLFTGATFLDGAAMVVAPDLYTAPSDPSAVGTDVEFTSDTVIFDSGDVSATLSSVAVVTFDASGVATTNTYAFTYDETEGEVVAPLDAPVGMFDVDSGMITIVVPTENATDDDGDDEVEIVQIYYTSVGGGEELVPVDPGSGFADYFAGDPDSAPLPVEVVDDPVDGPGFVVRFIGQAGVTYQLIAVDAVDDDWSLATEVGDPETPATAGVVQLVAPMTEDAQFYKIKATK